MKKQRRRVAKASDLAPSDAPDPRADVESQAQSEFVSTDEVVARLAVESVRSRIRHRALVKTLREGDFSWDRYTANMEQIEDSDAEALFSLLVLKWDVFEPRYREWMERDFEVYGFRRTREHEQNSSPSNESSEQSPTGKVG